MKNKKILLILENHIDKIVLGLVGLISIYLLWVYIIGNPYGQEVKGRKRSPSQIDSVVKKEADRLYAQLDITADPMRYDKSFLSEYEKLLACSLPDSPVTANLMPSPSAGDLQAQENRLYTLPKIPSLEDVQVASLRGGAQVPTDQVGPDQPYDSVPTELEDVDLITISARLDVQSLFTEFQQRFAGPRLKTAWKDRRLAKPVFARLELQRRTQQGSGSWGQWEIVSRTQIDAYQQLLEDLPLTLKESQFGVDAWLSQYNREEVQFDILQPEAYTFTISQLEWMPPEYLEEALEIMAKQEKQEAIDKQEERRKRSTSPTDRRRTPTRQPSRTRDRGAGGVMPGYDSPARTTRPTAPKEREVDDVKKDFELEVLGEDSDISSIREPMLIWAHDDSTEPGKTYQYRTRIGVFNPIAGKDWFQDDETEFKDQLVLWSNYSEPTNEVFIPKRIYVFPMNIIADKESSDAIEGVQVEVAKYQQGRWWDYDFDIVSGQRVGYEVEDIDQEDDMQKDDMGDFQSMSSGQDPDKIDFSSDVTLVDVARESVWGSRLRPGALYKMLYSDSEEKIRQVAIGKTNWDRELRGIYSEIQESMKQDIERRDSMTMPGGAPGMMPDFMEMYMSP